MQNINFRSLTSLRTRLIIHHLSAGFQEIPKPEETANKIEKDFLDRQGQQAPKTLSVFDVVFLIDSSGSISQEDFQVELQGMLALIKRMKPGTGIAALTFSTHARVIFPFLSAEVST